MSLELGFSVGMLLGAPVVSSLEDSIGMLLILVLGTSFVTLEGYLVGVSLGTMIGLMIGIGEGYLVGLSL